MYLDIYHTYTKFCHNALHYVGWSLWKVIHISCNGEITPLHYWDKEVFLCIGMQWLSTLKDVRWKLFTSESVYNIKQVNHFLSFYFHLILSDAFDFLLTELTIMRCYGVLLAKKVKDSLMRISFLCPRIKWLGAYCFCPVCLFVCLSVCLSVVNFNLRFNFWTVRNRDFIYGMHTPLMMPFQMTPRLMTLWPWLWPLCKK